MHILDVKKDFIVNDEIDHLPLYQNYNVDNPPILRHNSDVIVDSRGRSLIDICFGNQLRILNCMCFGDLFGRLTLGVWEGLRFVIVALPGLFSYFFTCFTQMAVVLLITRLCQN